MVAGRRRRGELLAREVVNVCVTHPQNNPMLYAPDTGRRLVERSLMGNSAAYDPETVQLLRAVLDEAWDALAPRHREQISKSHVAQCVLRRAAAGERHPGA